MHTTPTEPADAPLPLVGTEQAAEEAKKEKPPEDSGGSEIVSDAVEAVADIVTGIIFD